MGQIHEMSDVVSLETLFKNNKDKLIVIDFFATWCGPCKLIAPKFKKMSDEFSRVVFAKVDVDECEDIMANYDIKVMPTFILFKDGKQIDLVEGSIEEELRSKISKYA
ncbi:hypothetical protein WR25_20621 [Diploscapter pachys]|uniref:Thioredoxin domain-containing protein n=1 Tax=Diploscapter pachys TaxID=2018661 RepID=A0A2A2KZM7_9BILA|nr:hypothetical protein WR25_20621 [Diploscapter pachys]